MTTEQHAPLTESVYYIMLSLNVARHGYAIMQNIQELSDGRINMGAGTLYGAIKTLMKKEWIQPVKTEENSRKKQYCLTEEGKTVIQSEINRLQELIGNGKKIMRGDENDV